MKKKRKTMKKPEAKGPKTEVWCSLSSEESYSSNSGYTVTCQSCGAVGQVMPHNGQGLLVK